MNRLFMYLMCLLALSCQWKTEKEKLTKTNSATPKANQEKSGADTLLNTSKYLVLSDQPAIVKVVKETEIDSFPTFKVLTRYRNDAIIGQNTEYDDLTIFRKYRPQTNFSDYPSDIYKGKLAAPDFSTNPDAEMFRTRIENECAKGVNFAGHYTLVTWGCGAPCQSGAVVDRKTGEIFDGFETALGSEFKKNSRMIVRNVGAIDPATNLIEICAHCQVDHMVWTGTEFREVE